jgi:hypothetical protein
MGSGRRVQMQIIETKKRNEERKRRIETPFGRAGATGEA